jgi:hypothetical protein
MKDDIRAASGRCAKVAARAAGATVAAAPADSTARNPRRDGAVGIGEVRFMTAVPPPTWTSVG